MSVAETMKKKLSEALNPEILELIDESHKHAGHSGAPEGGESHFQLLIVTSQFEGISKVQRQRMVYEVLSEEMAGPVHALSLQTLTQKEYSPN